MKNIYILLTLLFVSNNAFSTSSFDPVLKEIVKFQEFQAEMNERYEKILSNKKFVTIQMKNTFYKQHNKNKKSLENFINKLYQSNKCISKNEFLQFLLEIRMQILLHRTENIEQKNLINVTPPLNEELFNSWMNKFDEKTNNEIKDNLELNTFAKENNIKRYQFIVSLIKKTFQILSIDELDKQTIQLLRASPSLWPILQNETFNLGNHDESAGYIRIQTYMKKFGIGFSDAIRQIRLNVTCPSWEKQKELYDLYWYESHFIEKERFIESKSLGAKNRHTKIGITCRITDYEAGECNDLPYPDFLKMQYERPFIESERFFDTVDFGVFSDEVEPVEEIITPPSQNTIDAIDAPVLQDKSENIVDILDLAPSKLISNNIINDEIVSDNIISDSDYLAPSGIRKFHNLMPDAPYPLLDLKKKDQKFVDKIFNSKTSHTISYGEFRKFWQKMGGNIIEDTGSSHKQLIGPKGDSLYGVAAHNDAQTYGKNTIKYFRAALYYIGCRPN